MLVLLVALAIFAWVVAVWWQVRCLKRERTDEDAPVDGWVPSAGMGGPAGVGHHHQGHDGGGFGGSFGSHGGHGGHGGH